MNDDGYGYNPEHVAAANYSGQGQGAGYMQLSFNKQSYRSPFNSNPNQGNFNLGYNRNSQGGFNTRSFYGNQPTGSEPRPSSIRPPGFH